MGPSRTLSFPHPFYNSQKRTIGCAQAFGFWLAMSFVFPACDHDNDTSDSTDTQSQTSNSNTTDTTESTGDETGTDATKSLPALPVAMNAFAAAHHNGSIFISGGHRGSAHDSSIESLSQQQWRISIQDSQPAWVMLGDLDEPTQQSTLFEYAGQLYRLGGLVTRYHTGEPLSLFSKSTFERYDDVNQQWIAMPSMPDTRASHSVAIADGVIYVTGGWKMEGPADSGVYHTTWLSFDLKNPGAVWQVHDQPFVVRDHCSAQHNGKVYVLGGMHSGVFPTETWVFDSAAPQLGWQAGPTLPAHTPLQGFGCSATSTSSNLFFSATDGIVFSLSSDATTWVQRAVLATPRLFHQLVAIDEANLVALGGGVGQSVMPIDSVEWVRISDPG